MIKKHVILLLTLLCCFGCTQTNVEKSRYEVYDSFISLKENQVPIAIQTKPYYQYACKLLNEYGSDNVLTENYTIVNNRLISASIYGEIPKAFYETSFSITYNQNQWILEINDEYETNSLGGWSVSEQYRIDYMCSIVGIDGNLLDADFMAMEFDREGLRKTKAEVEYPPNGKFTITLENMKHLYFQYQEILDLE